MAQDYDRKMSIMCMNYTEEQSSQLQTRCYMSMMRSSDLIYIYYVKLADGTMLMCDQTNLGEMDFTGMFDWVDDSMLVGRCDDTCYPELEEWQYNASDITLMSLGVNEYNPNIPAFYKSVVNLTSTDQEKFISCFSEFTSRAPPYLVFAIPGNCQSAPQQVELREPGEKKYRMAHHWQHKMKLNRRVQSRL